MDVEWIRDKGYKGLGYVKVLIPGSCPVAVTVPSGLFSLLLAIPGHRGIRLPC